MSRFESISYLSGVFLPQQSAFTPPFDGSVKTGNGQEIVHPNEVQKILQEFVDLLNNNERVNTRIASHVKKRASMPQGDFSLFTEFTNMGRNNGWKVLKPGSQDYVEYYANLAKIDGQHYVGLLCTKPGEGPETMCIATTSLSCGKEENNYYRSEALNNLASEIGGNPIIVQLQGQHIPLEKDTPLNDRKKVKLVNSDIAGILDSFHFGIFLLGITVEALYKYYPFIYLLPANMNRWIYDGTPPETRERYRVRYDDTAWQAGFEQQPNGLWRLNTKHITFQT